MMKVKKTANALELERMLPIDFMPARATPDSVGYDLRACIAAPLDIAAGKVAKIPTGVHVWIGQDTSKESGGRFTMVGLYFPRSSNNENLILTNTIGVLDPDYQGESFLKYKNIGDTTETIYPGQKIGQLVFTIAYIGELDQVGEFLETTERGEGGFGSTGN